DHVPLALCLQIDHEAVDVVRPRAAVEPVALQGDAAAAHVPGDVVGAGARARPDALRIDWQVGLDSEEERHRQAWGEVRYTHYEPNHEFVAASDNSGRLRGLAAEDVVRAHDVLDVALIDRWRAHRRRQEARDRPSEALRRHASAVAEADSSNGEGLG